MSERQDFKCLLCTTKAGVRVGVTVSAANLMFEEITVSDPFGEFWRFRIVEDASNKPLGWRIVEVTKGADAVTLEEGRPQ